MSPPPDAKPRDPHDTGLPEASHFRGADVLVTGAAGFIGSHLSEVLADYGARVFTLDNRVTPHLEHLAERSNVSVFTDSFLNEGLVRHLASRCQAIFHLGAAVGLRSVIGQLLHVIDVNVIGTKNVLTAAAEHDCRFLFASTSEIAGKSSRIPFGEDDDRVLGSISKDRWVYAETKALGEYMCKGYAREGLPVVVVRFFNAYGPRLDPEGSGRVISRFIRQVEAGGPVTVIGDGSQSRCFTYIDDVVKGLLLAMTSDEATGRTYNLGSTEETSIVQLLDALFEVMGRKVEIEHVDPRNLYGDGYEDIPRRVPDVTQARRELGFEAQVSLLEGLRRTVAWFEKEGSSW